jgi:hypothetical protein
MMKFNDTEEDSPPIQGQESSENQSIQSPKKLIGRKRKFQNGDLSEVIFFHHLLRKNFFKWIMMIIPLLSRMTIKKIFLTKQQERKLKKSQKSM